LRYNINIFKERFMSVISNSNINFNFKNSTYLTDHRLCFINNEIFSYTSGSGVGYNSMRAAILSSIGEFLERENMIPSKTNNSIYKNNFITGYSIIQEKSIQVEASKIITLYGLNNFSDSCGQASHIDSKSCIKNAVGEFIERQSFIFNYLSKGRSRLISLEEEPKFKYWLKKYKNLRFYDISIIDNFYVVLCKGIHNNNFYIGLGGSNRIDEAIFHSIKEALLCDYAYKLKNSNMNLYKDSRMDDYTNIFLNLSTQKLNEAYSYLDHNYEVYRYKDLVSYPFSIKSIFSNLNKKYNMDPLIFFLTPLRKIDGLKIVKIFDLNWFPSLCPKFYHEDTYNFVESITGKKLDRKCNFLPFP